MPHNWIQIAVGRVCTNCSLAQAKGEFDDDAPCTKGKPYKKRAQRKSAGGSPRDDADRGSPE